MNFAACIARVTNLFFVIMDRVKVKDGGLQVNNGCNGEESIPNGTEGANPCFRTMDESLR